MHGAIENEAHVLMFGPFRLQRGQRRLWRGEDEEIQLGGRAFDILVALIDNAGSIVTQRELIERAWPSVFVEDANLRVHIAGLRKALSDGQNGAHFIETVPRRGYCFVAPVAREDAVSAPAAADAGKVKSFRGNLPPALARMIGRQAEVADVVELIRERRFVSIVGAGGMGKTTVALSAAHALVADLNGAAVFVDLSAVSSGELVDVAVASALGLAAQSSDVMPVLVGYLRARRMLIVLDNCEHVIGPASMLAERLVAAAPELFLLATSREAMRVEGEHVYLLSALKSPPAEPGLVATEAMVWPAVQLFMDRAAAGGHRATLNDEEAPIVATICGRLDGIALAIELAAGRVVNQGIAGTAELLNHGLKLLWQGRRSATPRHQTMNAMVDWSFNLLDERERLVLTRLSIFVGRFTMSAAQQVVADDAISALEVADALVGLSEKSLVWTSDRLGEVRYRLLETTRAYAADKLEKSGDHGSTARRHALYVSDIVAHARATRRGERREQSMADLVGNLRSALNWSFSEAGELKLAVELTARSEPLLLSLSLLRECDQWCERALTKLEDDQRGSITELALWEGVASAGMFTRGNRPDVRAAIDRGLELAKALGSRDHELRLLSGLNIFQSRVGDVRGLMESARRAQPVAASLGSAEALSMADWMLGTAFHLCGDQETAHQHCEAALRRPVTSRGRLDAFGYDQRIRGLIILLRILWLRGYPEQAARLSHGIIAEAERRDQPIALCIAMIYTANVAIWARDLDVAESRVDRVIEIATAHSFEPYRAVGIAMRGELLVLRGDFSAGIAALQPALEILERERHRVLSTGFLRVLAEALSLAGREVEAYAALDSAFAHAHENGEYFQMPDLKRARGELWLRAPVPDFASAEAILREAIVDARLQSIRGWELRASASLARHLIDNDRRSEAVPILEEALSEIEEGYDQPEVRAMFRLLEQARDGQHGHR
jgi:predicted ATPase/DNA-binding winged helix-turn-helix (wHTH) protein